MAENGEYSIKKLFNPDKAVAKAVKKTQKPTIDKKSFDEIDDVLFSGLSKLIVNFSKDVIDGKIKIETPRDVQLVAGIMNDLKDQIRDDSDTPEVPQAVVNIYARALDTPDNENSVAAGIERTVTDWTPDQVEKFQKDRMQEQNNVNAND